MYIRRLNISRDGYIRSCALVTWLPGSLPPFVSNFVRCWTFPVSECVVCGLVQSVFCETHYSTRAATAQGHPMSALSFPVTKLNECSSSVEGKQQQLHKLKNIGTARYNVAFHKYSGSVQIVEMPNINYTSCVQALS